MGDCGSRPSHKEIEQHKQSANKTYDSHFIELTRLESKIESDAALLSNMRRYYSKRREEYEAILRTMQSGLPATPELNVEVQKGIGLDILSNCLNRGKPRVELKLEPSGSEFRTYIGDPMKPYWHQFFQFKQHNFGYDRLSVSLILLYPIGSPRTIGQVDFSMKSLEDQRLREDWYHMGGGVLLKLRVQLVYNLKVLYERLVQECDEMIESVDEKLQSSPN